MASQFKEQVSRGEIADLMRNATEDEDPRATYARVQARIRAIRSEGRPVPDNLVRFERALFADLAAESQGR